MAKINLEKLISSLIGNKSSLFALHGITHIDICSALLDQGLEYRDGAIVKVEQKKESLTEFERGYKQAIEDTCVFLHLEPVSFIDDYRKTMEQNLKKK